VHPNRYLDEADPHNKGVEKIFIELAWIAVKFHAKKMFQSKLHWRQQQIFWLAG
jgi:hypothetical protein